MRTQTVSLHQGWNSVYLEVTPTNSKPADCFRGLPVTVVAAYVGSGSTVQFVQNPSTNTVNGQNGWLVWYAASRPDAFLTRLFGMAGNTAYLIYAKGDCVWSVTGIVTLSSVKWRPSSFSFVGFGVNEQSPPTFEQFFAGSSAHHPYRIYRLVNNQWTLVDRAQSTQMRSGEACWVYCNGSSDYQGPLSVRSQLGQSVLVDGDNPAGILLANKSAHPLSVRVEAQGGGAQLPLGFVLRAVTESNVVAATYDLPARYDLPVFEAGESRGLWLALRAAQMTSGTQSSLLKITTDLGTECWLPVTGNRSGVSPSN